MFDKRFDIKSMALVSLHQTILTFTDESESTEFLKWDKVDISLFEDEKIPPGERARGLSFCYIVAYYFHGFELAARWSDQCRLISGYLKYIFPMHTFFDGMIATSMATKTQDKNKWKVIAKEAISKFRKWAVGCPENFEHKVKLLEAEMTSLNNNVAETIQLYDDAITLAKLHEFVNVEALACERAGIFCIKHNINSATYFLSRSYQAYSQWGATAKMRQMRFLFPEYIVHRGIPVALSTPGTINSSDSSSATVSELSSVFSLNTSSSSIKPSKKIRFS